MRKYIIPTYLLIFLSIGKVFAQSPTNIGWSGPGTSILNYNNACNDWSDFTCLGSGTATPSTFHTGVSYLIENDFTNTTACSDILQDVWMQVWDGDPNDCSSASPIGNPALNQMQIIPDGPTGIYFLTLSSMNTSAANNDCGDATGHDFTMQSAVIRYKQETTITNTTSTATLCMSEGKELNYSLSGPHNNPIPEWEVVVGDGQFIGNYFYPETSGTITLRARIGDCYDDISYQAVVSETAPNAIQGPNKICEGSLFTLEAIGGNTLANTTYEWGTGNIPGQNIIATTTNPIYQPDPIFSNTTYWVRKKGHIAPCDNYTLATFHEIEVYNDIPLVINAKICEGDTYYIGNYEFTTPLDQHIIVFQTQDLACDSTIILNLEIEPYPVGLFLSNDTICDGQSIILDAGNPGATYQWDNGSQERTIEVSDPGTYTVEITSPTGCSYTDTANIEVLYVYPEFSLIHVQSLGINKFRFEVLDPIDIHTVYWDMGDGSPLKHGFNIEHTYENSGNYVVNLSLESICGSISAQISAHALSLFEQEKNLYKWYPNPAKDYIILDTEDNHSIQSIRMIDITGRELLVKEWKNVQNNLLALDGFNAGIYYIQIIDKEGRILQSSPIEIRQ